MKREEQVVNLLRKQGLSITTMESCTGGYVLERITSVPGASAITLGGFITYSNALKIKMGVSAKVIDKHGVYSRNCAVSMAKACRRNTNANIGIGVTGTLSNPDATNSDSKPGIVYYCIYLKRVNEDTCMERKLQVPINMSRDNQRVLIAQSIFDDLISMLS